MSVSVVEGMNESGDIPRKKIAEWIHVMDRVRVKSYIGRPVKTDAFDADWSSRPASWRRLDGISRKTRA
jgi:hypothetical protein